MVVVADHTIRIAHIAHTARIVHTVGPDAEAGDAVVADHTVHVDHVAVAVAGHRIGWVAWGAAAVDATDPVCRLDEGVQEKAVDAVIELAAVDPTFAVAVPH